MCNLTDCRIAILFLIISITISCKKAHLANESKKPPTSIINDKTQNNVGTETPTSEKFFSIVVLPDTQYYISEKRGGTISMFRNQITWILENRQKERIAYVAHVGDITEASEENEWILAREIMNPLLTNDIPFGVAVGNHDGLPAGKPSLGNVNTGYNRYFGKQVFVEKEWYGGSLYTNNANDCHFDLFSVHEKDFIAIYMDYNEPGHWAYNPSHEAKVLEWVDSLLSTHYDRKAIIISHCLLELPELPLATTYFGNTKFTYTTSIFSPQGKNVYNAIKAHKNVFLMLCGHHTAESLRIDRYNGGTIKTILSDYQFRGKGGDGFMRLIRINETKQIMTISTFIPDEKGNILFEELDADSKYEVPLYD